MLNFIYLLIYSRNFYCMRKLICVFSSIYI